MNRLTEDKAMAIARAYYANGRKKIEALKSVGYSDNYAENGGLKLFVNDSVVKALAVLEAELRENAVWTAEESEKELKGAIALSKQQRQPTAIVSAVQALNKMLGLDKASGSDEKVRIIIEKPDDYPKLTKETG